MDGWVWGYLCGGFGGMLDVSVGFRLGGFS